MKKFVPCNKCNNGYIYSDDGLSVIKCDCLKEYQHNSLVELRKTKAGIEDFNLILDDYKGKDSEQNIKKLKRFCSDFSNFKSSCLYLYGPNGTQKSSVSKEILNTLINLYPDFKGKFILMNSLMDIICDIFNKDENKKDIQYLEDCDLLVIDDCFSAKKVTLYKNSKDYQMSFLDAFLRKRIEQNKKSTIFTANVSIEEIEKNGFSYDIQNLLSREILYKKGQLIFSEPYINSEYDINVKSMWD